MAMAMTALVFSFTGFDVISQFASIMHGYDSTGAVSSVLVSTFLTSRPGSSSSFSSRGRFLLAVAASAEGSEFPLGFVASTSSATFCSPSSFLSASTAALAWARASSRPVSLSVTVVLIFGMPLGDSQFVVFDFFIS